jgi:hypothetical protein
VLRCDYQVFDPGVYGPLGELPRAEAKAAYHRLMAAREARIEMVRALISHNGVDVDSSYEGLQRANDWFRREVTGHPPTCRLDSVWYSVVNDLALLIGEAIIERCPHLTWTFMDRGPRKSPNFQRHVIVGFRTVSSKTYNLDVDLGLATYGHRVILDLPVDEGAFLTW